MKRRTPRRLRPGRQPEHHHNVYVVLLDPAVARLRKVRAANPDRAPAKPCVYVGMLDKASSVVKRYGIRVLPELYAHLNPMPFEAAAQMEQDLADWPLWLQIGKAGQ
jgi:hypothetical protein